MPLSSCTTLLNISEIFCDNRCRPLPYSFLTRAPTQSDSLFPLKVPFLSLSPFSLNQRETDRRLSTNFDGTDMSDWMITGLSKEQERGVNCATHDHIEVFMHSCAQVWRRVRESCRSVRWVSLIVWRRGILSMSFLQNSAFILSVILFARKSYARRKTSTERTSTHEHAKWQSSFLPFLPLSLSLSLSLSVSFGSAISLSFLSHG